MQSAGAYLDSNFLQSVRSRALGIFALVAILLHVTVPTAYSLSGPATQDLLKTVICSDGVAKEVYIDKDGNLVHPSTVDHDACKFSCLHHCAALTVATIAMAKPDWAIVLSLLTGASPADAPNYGASHPRAPPA